MHLLIYFPARQQPGHPYASLLTWEDERLQKEFHDNVDSLGQRLHSPLNPNPVVVLVLDNQAQLEEMLALGPLLEGLALTVILPSREPQLVDRAHLLRPRFLTYQDQDPELLLAVLGNLLLRSWPSEATSVPPAQDQHLPGQYRRRLRLA